MSVVVDAQVTCRVVRVEKQVGDKVDVEETLMVLESMKMEIPVEAPCGGTLTEIRVAEGDAIEEGAVLAVID